MAKSQILNYYIHLADKALVEQYQASLDAQSGPGQMLFDPASGKTGILRAPDGGASVEFSAPIQNEDVTFTAPSIRSPWFVPATNNFPRTVATFTRKSGGWFGLPILFGSTTRFYWVGHFIYSQPVAGVQDETGEATTAPARIPQRLMIAGFEITGGEGLQDAVYQGAASGRFPGGRGFTQRNVAATGNIASWNPTTQPALGAWSRHRFRVRKMPASRATIWNFEQPAQAFEGLRIDIDSTGNLSFVERDTGATISTYAAGLTASETAWHKLDICIIADGRDGPPIVKALKMSVWLNGAHIADVAHSDPSGAATGIQIQAISVGRNLSEVQTAEIDFDDWMVAKLPEDKDYNDVQWASGSGYTAGDVVQMAAVDAFTYPSQVEAYVCLLTHGAPSPNPSTAPGATWARLTHSKDFASGSRIEIVRPTGVNGENTFAGDYRLLLNREPSGTELFGMTSSTSGAILSVTTDVADVMKIPGALGIVAAAVALYGHRGTGDGTLGYNINAGGNVMSAIAQGAAGAPTYYTATPRQVLYAPGPMAEPIIPATLTLRHVKGADAGLSTQYQLAAIVEVIGVFGPEDVLPALDADDEVIEHVFPATHGGQHNAAYPLAPWTRQDARAMAPVILVGGTYVGNGTCTELTFRAPVHFLWVRRVTGTGDVGFKWIPAMIAAHESLNEGPTGNAVARAEIDPTFVPVGGEDDQAQRYRLRITGSGAQVNAGAVTYQYIAVCDPGARLMLTDAFLKDDLAPGIPGTVTLADPDFLPLAALLFSEARGNNLTQTAFLKGPGLSGANDAVQLPGTVQTLGLTFSQGAMVVESGVVASDPYNIAYAVFRQDDDSGGDVHKVFGLVGWTGDAAGARTISLAPATGLRPLFAIAGAAGGSGFWRDPSHPTTNSGNLGTGTQGTTGFTAGGIDSFTVGAGLNAAGVEYTALVIWGSATAGNGGWSINGEFTPVEPDTPGILEPEEIQAPAEGDPGSGEGPPPDLDDISDDLADAACVTPSTTLVNLALQRIGVSNKVATLATENTLEAVEIRTAYDETLQETLRAHPWPFATRYAALTLLGGTASSPATTEWQYSYVMPDDCVFPRRLVTSRGRAVDPTPPPFREAGGQLFTNQAVAVLEYTSRVHCPAIRGDATFRSAWAWRLAGALAPVLTRMPEKEAHCLQMWESTISLAMRFLRLGAPGLRSAADPNDPDLNSLSVKLQTINVALSRIGAKTIADLTTEQSREAVTALLLYEDELRAVIRDFPWPFATRYRADLTLVAGPAWDGVSLETWDADTDYLVGDAVVDALGDTYYAIVDHNDQEPPNVTYWDTEAPGSANGDWAYGYRVPLTSVGIRRLVNSSGVGRAHDPSPPRYRMGSNGGGLVLFTNEQDPTIEFAIRPTDALSVADPGFKDAFGWRLAAALAMSLPLPDPEKEEQTGQAPKNEHREPRRSEGGQLQLHRARAEKARWAWAMYERALSIAKTQTANEMQPEDHGDAPWITGRG